MINITSSYFWGCYLYTNNLKNLYNARERKILHNQCKNEKLFYTSVTLQYLIQGQKICGKIYYWSDM